MVCLVKRYPNPLIINIPVPRRQPHDTLSSFEDIPGMTTGLALRLYLRWLPGLSMRMASLLAWAGCDDPVHNGWAIKELADHVRLAPEGLRRLIGPRPRGNVAVRASKQEATDLIECWSWRHNYSYIRAAVPRIIWLCLCLNIPGRDVLVRYLEAGDENGSIDRVSYEDAVRFIQQNCVSDALSEDDKIILAGASPESWARLRGFTEAGNKIIRQCISSENSNFDELYEIPGVTSSGASCREDQEPDRPSGRVKTSALTF